MYVALAFLPIVLTMCAGYAMAARGTISKEGWGAIETLSFKLLIPVVLIRSIASSELAPSDLVWFIGGTVFALCLAGVLVFGLRAVQGAERLPNPDFTTLFQTTIRWNAFIALAAAELLSGPAALALIAAAMAILIPLINIFSIVVLARFGTARPALAGVFLLVAKNPLVQGCAIGLALNVSGFDLPAVIVQTLDLIGRAALGIGLLTVGAALSVKRLFHASPAVVAGVGFRLVLGPGIFVLVAWVLGLSQIETLAGLLVLSVPAASNGYIVAKQMGGNAELYADVLSWQTILSMFALPFYVTVVLAA